MVPYTAHYYVCEQQTRVLCVDATTVGHMSVVC